jgi:hypothetical protein
MRRTGLAASISMGLALGTAADAWAAPSGVEGEYTYPFDDDPLLVSQPPTGCRWPRKRSVMIIRPRLHFARALIETIEKM